jgi:hypothetical protein
MTESQPPPVLPLPCPLPRAFAEKLGYRRERRFVAAYWEPGGDVVTLRDDSFLAGGFGDWFPWTKFFHKPEVMRWRIRNNINLGNSDEEATHWLIIDRNTNRGFVAPLEEAYKRVQQQRMENVE